MLLTKVAVWRWYVIATQCPVLEGGVVVEMGERFCVGAMYRATWKLRTPL